jgi:hypothetical protein
MNVNWAIIIELDNVVGSSDLSDLTADTAEVVE